MLLVDVIAETHGSIDVNSFNKIIYNRELNDSDEISSVKVFRARTELLKGARRTNRKRVKFLLAALLLEVSAVGLLGGGAAVIILSIR